MPSAFRKFLQRRTGRKRSEESFLDNNSVSLVRGGTAFFTELKKLIDSAKHSLHIQTYVFADDETGLSIGKALVAAAERDVAVYVLADGYASQATSKEFVLALI